MEREFTDYDEWMQHGGDATYGQGVSQPNPYTPQAPSAGPGYLPWTDPDTAPPNLGDPNQQPGGNPGDGNYWAWDGSRWIIRSMPRATQPTTAPNLNTDTPYPTTYSNNGGLPNTFGQATQPNAGFQWPTYNAPRFNFGEFPGFKPFKPPTADEILNDPVLNAQLKEGNNRIKQDRAFRGILNTGDTLKDIFDWTSDRIKLGGHDAFDRAFKVYDVNDRQNPFNTWTANKGLALDTFDRNAGQMKDEFTFNQFEPAKRLWEQNYNQWAKTGDWLSNSAVDPD